MINGEHTVESSIGSWRKKATDVYSLFMCVTTLPVVLVIPFLEVVLRIHVWLAVTAWLLALSAAVFRRVNVRRRILLMVAGVWLYAALLLTRGGIYNNFRLSLVNLTMMAMILGGVRLGLSIGGINLLFMIAAVWGTYAGFFPQTTPQLNDTEVLLQSIMVFMNFVPQFLLLAWFSYHLTASVRHERETAVRLQEEMTLRQRLEGEVVEANENISRHIGSELHDGVCQDLTGLMLNSKRAQKTLASENRPEAKVLSGIVDGLGEAIGEIHGLSKRLSPGALTGRDLAGAIGDLVQRSSEVAEAGIEFHTEADGPVLDSGATLHLYRIAQEAIANAMRHSGADRIKVLLKYAPTETLLRVEDNGHWQNATTQRGLGQSTIRWRASVIGGTLLVGPMPEGGTRVECRIPLRNEVGESNDEA